MTILELEMKIAADRRMDRLPVNIGERPCYDEMFNLVRQENGKWATFYGEHGGTTNKREYDSPGEYAGIPEGRGKAEKTAAAGVAEEPAGPAEEAVTEFTVFLHLCYKEKGEPSGERW